MAKMSFMCPTIERQVAVTGKITKRLTDGPVVIIGRCDQCEFGVNSHEMICEEKSKTIISCGS